MPSNGSKPILVDGQYYIPIMRYHKKVIAKNEKKIMPLNKSKAIDKSKMIDKSKVVD